MRGQGERAAVDREHRSGHRRFGPGWMRRRFPSPARGISPRETARKAAVPRGEVSLITQEEV